MFNRVYDELIDVFSGSHGQDFESIDKDLLSDLCEFLKRFDQVIEILSDETQPTLHKVIPLRILLINHCEINPDDKPGMKMVKRFLSKRKICCRNG